jgi:hypothetical protein
MQRPVDPHPILQREGSSKSSTIKLSKLHEGGMGRMPGLHPRSNSASFLKCAAFLIGSMPVGIRLRYFSNTAPRHKSEQANKFEQATRFNRTTVFFAKKIIPEALRFRDDLVIEALKRKTHGKLDHTSTGNQS